MKLFVRALGVAALLPSAFGCTSPGDERVVVARIDGDAVLYSEFEDFVSRNLAQDPRVLPDEALAALFFELIDERCLERLAHERGFTSADDGPSPVEQLLVDLESERISEAALRSYYEDHAEDFQLPERVVLGQLLIQDLDVAVDVLSRLRGGAPFEKVADGFDDVVFSGYQADMTRQDLPPGFVDEIFGLAAGESSGILEADYGFHVFRVEATAPEEQLSLEEARAEIEARLRSDGSSRSLEALLSDARLRYNVELLPRNLPFKIETSDTP